MRSKTGGRPRAFTVGLAGLAVLLLVLVVHLAAALIDSDWDAAWITLVAIMGWCFVGRLMRLVDSYAETCDALSAVADAAVTAVAVQSQRRLILGDEEAGL